MKDHCINDKDANVIIGRSEGYQKAPASTTAVYENLSSMVLSVSKMRVSVVTGTDQMSM